MSFDWEGQVGEKLDQALAENLNLHFQPAWHPRNRMARQRSRSWRLGLGTTAAAAAVFLSLPFFVQPSQGQRQASTGSLAVVRLPKPLRSAIRALSSGSYNVVSLVPAYQTYPLSKPTGYNLRVAGQFVLGGHNGDSLSLLLNTHMQIESGVVFKLGMPVYSFSGSSSSKGTAIVPAKSMSQANAGPNKAQWYTGGYGAIDTFSAAGSHVYVTHGNLWADIVPGTNPMWMQSPALPAASTVDTVAGLPSSPDSALLLEEAPSGLSRGFITVNGGTTWKSWGLGRQSATMLIAIGNRYWAIYNGTLAWSTDGQGWHTILPLDAKHWQVQTYAIDPVNQKVAVVALIPIGGDGIGPVLQTKNGGETWSQVPNFPPMGAAPTTMVMSTNGDVSALINAGGPVVVRYLAAHKQWSILPVPSQGSGTQGLGQLAANANGNLIYGAPNGVIYESTKHTGQWVAIQPPSGLDNAGVAAFPLQAVGNSQILAGYPSGWGFVYWPSSAK